jgi:hypothetical protein
MSTRRVQVDVTIARHACVDVLQCARTHHTHTHAHAHTHTHTPPPPPPPHGITGQHAHTDGGQHCRCWEGGKYSPAWTCGIRSCRSRAFSRGRLVATRLAFLRRCQRLAPDVHRACTTKRELRKEEMRRIRSHVHAILTRVGTSTATTASSRQSNSWLVARTFDVCARWW